MFREFSRFNEAVEEYKKALKLEPMDLEIRYSIVSCLENLGRNEEAQKELKTLKQMDPLFTKGYIRKKQYIV